MDVKDKKFTLASLLCFIFLLVTEYLINLWLMPVYEQYAAVWRPMEQMQNKWWIMWVAQYFFAVMFVYIYTKGVEDKPWLGQGIRYGIIMILFTTIPFTLSNYFVYPIPYTLALKWMVAGAVQLIVMGIVVAALCKKAPASA